MGVEPTVIYPVEKFLLAFALILIASKLFGEIAERIKQPAVLGELIAGVVLGGSVLAVIPSVTGELGYDTFHLLSEIGVSILLFEIGLETDLKSLLRVGIDSALVAIIGVITPFVLGYAAIVMFDRYGLLGSGLSPSAVMLIALTVGATLTATSVGITARVLSDLGLLHTPEAKVILGAAVIDDVIGLVILAVVSGIIEATESGVHASVSVVGVGYITLKAFGFLLVAIVLGNLFSKRLFDLVDKMRVRGVLLVISLAFALLFAYVADLMGLAPIVGAFAAGLVLATTSQFELISERLKPVADVFTPIFFVVVGAAVDIRVFNPFHEANLPVLLIAGALTVIAVVSKLASGLGITKKGIRRLSVGVGMIPRGEVGLIFAQVGLGFAVFDTRLFSAITVMIMLTTFIAPPLLKLTFPRKHVEEEGGETK